MWAEAEPTYAVLRIDPEDRVGDIKDKKATSFQRGTQEQYEAAASDDSITINEIQSEYSDYKVYQWTDADQKAYWWSEADKAFVADAEEMFSGCDSLIELDLSGLVFDGVQEMDYMFANCESLTSINFGADFDTSIVMIMDGMFGGCTSLTYLDLSGFDTSDLYHMEYMFTGCNSLKSIYFGPNFDTSKVTDMSGMFRGCGSLTSLDLHSFDTSKVTDMSDMFSFCNSLTDIFVGDKWNTDKVTNSDDMFEWDSSLPNFDDTCTDKTRAYYGGDGLGYLTYKAA